MAIFKRIEVWFLLLLMLAGLAFVFLPQLKEKMASGGADPAEPKEPEGTVPFEILRSEIIRNGDHAIVKVAARYQNRTAEELTFAPPAVRLFGKDDTEIEPYFLPGHFPPAVRPGKKADVTLEYWASADDLLGLLSLEILGRRVQVKSPAPFTLASIDEGSKQIFTARDWAQ